jgi:hypothetical protein
VAKESRQRLWQSTDFVFEHTILTPAEDAAVDVTGWMLSWMVKRSLDDEDANKLLEKTTDLDGGITVTGAFNANIASNTQRVEVAIDAADTRDLQPGKLYYELKRMDAGFEAPPLAYGVLDLVRGVHRQ